MPMRGKAEIDAKLSADILIKSWRKKYNPTAVKESATPRLDSSIRMRRPNQPAKNVAPIPVKPNNNRSNTVCDVADYITIRSCRLRKLNYTAYRISEYIQILENCY